MPVLALTTGNAIILIVAITIPVAAITFMMGASNALRQIGKGQFSVQYESDLPKRPNAQPEVVSAGVREAEIRQMLEAKAYRQRERGDEALDVDAELARLLAEEEGPSELGKDAQLREEVRQLVVARNERRMRQGKEPLDVEREVQRQLRDLENLGQ